MKDFIEIERKFIIEKPSFDLMSACHAESTSIVQIYLKAPEGVTRRIRKRTYKDGIRYFETVKKRIDKISSYEDECEISESDFLEKSKEIKEGTRPLLKDRITFECFGKIIEIDVYPEWEKSAIMEIELDTRDEEIKLPDFIKIIKEVTGNYLYSNAKMAERFPEEE